MLSGCSSVVSTPMKPADWKNEVRKEGGVTYWLPRRAINVALTVNQSQGDSVVVNAGLAYPEYARAFLLRQADNLLAEQKLKVTGEEGGLLQGAVASSSPQLAEALKGVASTIAVFQRDLTKPAPAPVCPDGSYSLQVLPEKLDLRGEGIDVEVGPPLCGYTVTMARLFPDVLVTRADELTILELKASNGFYVRPQLPYRVTVSKAAHALRQFIVMSPSEAPPAFVPLASALFAATSTTLALGNGSIKDYDQTKPSELVAFLTLPAQVIGAYFDAIGNLFSKREAAAVSEAEFLKARADLSTTQLQSDLCRAAVQQASTLDDVKPACLPAK